MKKVFIVLIVLFAGMANFAQAQTPKFGHIDISQLIQIMPERTTAVTEMEKTAKELEDMLGEYGFAERMTKQLGIKGPM